ncbi:SGNH/GDSL hydrolase family protein [Enterobacter roggenkampii]|nr:SGNH/GDSL hydrolase family protein [Enterobacter roggenkampii]WEY55853.1 SGNH/GDSL hydrolase family protein [Enterobacter roggenkampii]
MHGGESFIIPCFGDSSIDGNGTSNWIQNPIVPVTGHPWATAPVANTNHNAEAPNAWTNKLQYILREYHRNNNISVYNAGYSGQQMQNGWANYYFEKAILQNPFIPENPDIVILGFGLNDITDAGNRIEQHITQTIEVMKKVLAAGATPVLLTCDTNWRSYHNWASGVSGRDNEEAAAQIDQAKHYMAEVFGVPIIDMDSFEKKWITTNSEGDSLGYLQPDGLHFGDTGHAMKAGIIARHFMPDIYHTNGTAVERMDWKDSRSRFRFGDQDSWSPPSNDEAGHYSRFPIIWYLGTDDYSPGELVMDAWVWSDGEQPSLIYRGYGNSNIGSDHTLAQLPYITVNWLSDAEPYYTKPIPATGYNDAYDSPTDRPYYLTKLKYGLNRVRLYCPAIVKNIFWGGWFELNPRWKAKDTFDWVNNINSPSFVQTDALAGIGPMYLRYPANAQSPQVAFMFPEAMDGSNLADFGQIGDIVDILVEGYFDVNTGFLLFGGKSLNRQSGSSNDDQEDSCLMLFANSASTFNLMQLRYPLQEGDPYPTIQAGNAAAFVDQNRTFLIRCQRTDITTQTITVYVGNNDSGAVALSYTGGWSKGAFAAAGIIGGIYVNRSSSRTININRVLVRKYR